VDPVDFKILIGDKAFDSDALRDTHVERGADAVIPPKTNRTVQRLCLRVGHTEGLAQECLAGVLPEMIKEFI